MKKNLQFKNGQTPWKMIISISLSLTSLCASAQEKKTMSKPSEMVGALYAVFGNNHSRAVHAKGIILKGDFEPTAAAKKLCMAFQFQYHTDVTIRFSDFTGIPNIADTTGLSNPRGLAVKFHSPDGTASDIVAHSFNGFPVGTTDEFVELLTDISKSGPDVPHPNPLEIFFGTHPAAKTFLTTQKQPTTSYATLSYFGANSYKFTNDKGVSQYIRYQFIPVAGEHFLTPEELKKSGPDYLSEEIRKRIENGEIKFKLYAQLSGASDKIEDSSIAWPDSRKRILLGTLTIKSLSENSIQEDKSLKFNPINISKGITFADHMLEDRAKAYPISVKERQ